MQINVFSQVTVKTRIIHNHINCKDGMKVTTDKTKSRPDINHNEKKKERYKNGWSQKTNIKRHQLQNGHLQKKHHKNVMTTETQLQRYKNQTTRQRQVKTTKSGTHCLLSFCVSFGLGGGGLQERRVGTQAAGPCPGAHCLIIHPWLGGMKNYKWRNICKLNVKLLIKHLSERHLGTAGPDPLRMREN